MRFDTKAIRVQAKRSSHGEHAVPIYATSGYVFDTASDAAAAFDGTFDHPLYGRFDNPNTDEFATKIAALENAERAIATASGMSAVVTSVLGLLQGGDHVVGSYHVFGSTLRLMREYLPRFGIETSLVDLSDLDAWEAACRRNTKMFLLETPSNPSLEVVDLRALSEIARSRGIYVNVDNCFATPVLQRPIEHGADIVTHSATKFIDGQGRVLGGAVAASEEIIGAIMPFYRTTGPTLSAFNGWILSRSLETLSIRMARHCETASELADRLQSADANVFYPGLASYPQHDIVQRQMDRPGALLTIDLETKERAMGFLDSLEIISRSVNLGDSRTIATHPATTTHSGLPDELKKRLAITEGLVRVSIGLEDVEDLWDDLQRGLQRIAVGKA